MNADSWRLLEHDFYQGDINMGIDLVLLNSCERGISPPTLRIYGWKTPTLSIGRNQKIDNEINLSRCRDLGIPVVRRPTGGKAILHGSEITYAIAAPANHPKFLGGICESFNIIGQALMMGLEEITDSKLSLNEENGSSMPVNRDSPACFATLNKFEILFDGRKLVGSAQKRTRKAFIQHGSILIDFDAELFVSLLHINDSCSPTEQVDKLNQSVVTLNQIRKNKVNYDEAVFAIQNGFQNVLSGHWVIERLSDDEEKLSKEFAKSAVL